MTTADSSPPIRFRQRHRAALAALAIGVLFLGLALAVHSSGSGREDPVRASLVDSAGLTDEAVTCILHGAADRGVDVDELRTLILDPGADATISQADQRTLNEVATACLDG